MWTYLTSEEQQRLATFAPEGETERERFLLHAERRIALAAIGTNEDAGANAARCRGDGRTS